MCHLGLAMWQVANGMRIRESESVNYERVIYDLSKGYPKFLFLIPSV